MKDKLKNYKKASNEITVPLCDVINICRIFEIGQRINGVKVLNNDDKIRIKKAYIARKTQMNFEKAKKFVYDDTIV